ncbi:hypothetical protein [Sphingopyxis sp. PET50]|uniref:hypothetical protein n=1 Tax=Sphingopyxis sp. PET50 TaxID=2976533 RepID=UPI0021B00C8C|nr:hypothetical protein [Sphingopyxis sp. PET50]
MVATIGAAAAVGGVLGNVVAGQGYKTLGTVIGAVGRAVIGNQIAKPGRDCRDTYGYYDTDRVCRLAPAMRFHLRPLGVHQYKAIHPKCESHLATNGNPESPQALNYRK